MEIAAEPPVASAPENNGSPPPPETSRILIVEDDRITRMILVKRLTSAGYEVEEAVDGVEGWEKARRFDPDIILTDWMMPNMDGPGLCAKVRQEPRFRSTYLLMLTARDRNEDKVKALDAGADEYLIKPCEAGELLARIRAAERIVALQRNLEEKNDALKSAIARINEELRITSEIQLSLLPQQLPSIAGYRFAAFYRPSTECSGDYYDLLDLGDGRFGMIIADVSGHGTPSMVAMALGRTLMHLTARRAAAPAEFLQIVNRLLFDHLPTNQFMTAFYGICDPKSGIIRYSSAGHNPPLLINREEGRAEYLKNCEGFPLKLVTRDATYDNSEIRLRPGDALLLYTDGIPEASNPEGDMFETERLSRAALESDDPSPEGMVNGVIERMMTFTERRPLADDVSMMMIMRED